MGSESMLGHLAENDYDLLCLHGAVVGNHKAPDFDVIGALEQNTHNLPTVMDRFKSRGGKAVIATGTYFEVDEGIGTQPREAFSPYALSKTLTWQATRYYAHQAGIPLAKFVVANPFGPMEKGGFTQYLIQSWRKGEKVVVRTPEYIRDNVPVDLMALHYRDFCTSLATHHPPLATRHSLPVTAHALSKFYCAPSWFTGSQGDFTAYFAKKFHQITGLNTPFKLAQQKDFSEPIDRRNSGQKNGLQSHQWDEESFWQEYAKIY